MKTIEFTEEEIREIRMAIKRRLAKTEDMIDTMVVDMIEIVPMLSLEKRVATIESILSKIEK